MKNFFWFVGRLFVGFVFSFSGLSKLLEPSENFRAVLEAYPMVTGPLAGFLSIVIPWFEWIFGFFMVAGYMTRWIARLLFVFAAGLITLLISSLRAYGGGSDCGCFGAAGLKLTQGQVLILDIVMGCLLLGLALKKHFLWSLDSLFPKVLEVGSKFFTRQPRIKK